MSTGKPQDGGDGGTDLSFSSTSSAPASVSPDECPEPKQWEKAIGGVCVCVCVPSSSPRSTAIHVRCTLTLRLLAVCSTRQLHGVRHWRCRQGMGDEAAGRKHQHTTSRPCRDRQNQVTRDRKVREPRRVGHRDSERRERTGTGAAGQRHRAPPREPRATHETSG